MERVLILGCSGAGKSSLARKMAAILSLPAIHLDRHYWRPGWVEPDKVTWKAEVATLVQRPKWVMDGTYASTLAVRLAAADTVVYLDFPTWICLLRVLRRTLVWFGRTRGDDMGVGCRERIDWAFLRYIWRFRREQGPRVIRALDTFGGRALMLRRPKEVESFVRHLHPAALNADAE